MMTDLTIERLDLSLPMPEYKHEGDAGFDLYVRLYGDHYPLEGITLLPNQTVKVGVNYRMHIPDGHEVQIRPRSGLASQGIVAQFGTVDSGYRGEIMVNLTNTNSDISYDVEYGDRIAQAVLAPVTRANIIEGSVYTDTSRGEDGFGSTGT